MIKIKIHTILGLKEILGQRVVELPLPQGSTIKALLAVMAHKWGRKFSSYVSDPGHVHLLPHIRILVNGRDIGFINGMETELQDGDEVLMLPLAGGG